MARWLTIKELSKAVGVGVKTLYKWRRQRKITGILVGKARYRYDLAQVVPQIERLREKQAIRQAARFAKRKTG